MAGGAALEHVFNGTVHQVIPSPIAGARLAALKTLKSMGMTVEKDERSEDRWTVLAKAGSRNISIEFMALSDKSARMSLKGSWGDFVFFNELSKADAFIKQIEIELSRLTFKQIRIATAQMLLSDLGYDTINADGVVGDKTRNAIVRFQRNNAIRKDGKVSTQLITMLRKQQAAHAPLSGNRLEGLY